MLKIKIFLKEAKVKIGKTQKPGKENDGDAEQFAALRKLVTDKDLKYIPGFAELLHMGYMPIMLPNKKQQQYNGYIPQFNAFLGGGAFGDVFEVVDKSGKRYAAKIAPAGEPQNKKELFVRKKIESIRGALPANVSKHFVRLYKIQKLKLTPVHGEFYIFIMELARKMNDAEEQVLYKGLNSVKEKVPLNKYRLYPDSFVADFNNILKSDSTLEDGASPVKKEKVPLLKNNMLKIVVKNKQKLAHIDFNDDINKNKPTLGIAWHAARQIYDKLLSFELENETAQYGVKSDMLKPGRELKNSLNKIARLITNLIHEFIAVKLEKMASADFKFGGEGSEYNQYAWSSENFDQKAEINFNKSNAPEEVKSFINALLYLKKHHKIKWMDLPERNVMIDRQRGHYVAVDLGLFEI